MAVRPRKAKQTSPEEGQQVALPFPESARADGGSSPIAKEVVPASSLSGPSTGEMAKETHPGTIAPPLPAEVPEIGGSLSTCTLLIPWEADRGRA